MSDISLSDLDRFRNADRGELIQKILDLEDELYNELNEVTRLKEMMRTMHHKEDCKRSDDD